VTGRLADATVGRSYLIREASVDEFAAAVPVFHFLATLRPGHQS
jgi:hypothetical protein